MSSMKDLMKVNTKSAPNKFQPKTVIRGGNKNNDGDKPIVIRKK
jgi:hypothetical protein